MKKRPIKLCAISILFFTLLIWTIWGNTALTVNNIKISSSRIPATFSGFRIAQVSDLVLVYKCRQEKLNNLYYQVKSKGDVQHGEKPEILHSGIQAADRGSV